MKETRNKKKKNGFNLIAFYCPSPTPPWKKGKGGERERERGLHT